MACRNPLLLREGDTKWIRPASGHYRLDVDFGDGSIGAIVRDSNGDIFAAMAKPIGFQATVLEGELRAILYGICLCKDLKVQSIEVFTDSLLAISLILNEENNNNLLCEELVEAIREVKKQGVVFLKHMRREANKAAHSLAEHGKNLDRCLVWNDNWPPWLLDIVSADSSS